MAEPILLYLGNVVAPVRGRHVTSPVNSVDPYKLSSISSGLLFAKMFFASPIVSSSPLQCRYLMCSGKESPDESSIFNRLGTATSRVIDALSSFA